MSMGNAVDTSIYLNIVGSSQVDIYDKWGCRKWELEAPTIVVRGVFLQMVIPGKGNEVRKYTKLR